MTVATPPFLSTCTSSMWPTILRCMGFDPNRPMRKTPADYVFVAAAVLVGVALVLWAFLG